MIDAPRAVPPFDRKRIVGLTPFATARARSRRPHRARTLRVEAAEGQAETFRLAVAAGGGDLRDRKVAVGQRFGNRAAQMRASEVAARSTRLRHNLHPGRRVRFGPPSLHRASKRSGDAGQWKETRRYLQRLSPQRGRRPNDGHHLVARHAEGAHAHRFQSGDWRRHTVRALAIFGPLGTASALQLGQMLGQARRSCEIDTIFQSVRRSIWRRRRDSNPR